VIGHKPCVAKIFEPQCRHFGNRLAIAVHGPVFRCPFRQLESIEPLMNQELAADPCQSMLPNGGITQGGNH
jgi:hypothetical protein